MRRPCISLFLLLLPLSQCTQVDPRCEIPNADKIDCAPFEADCAAAVLLICTLNIIILVVFDMTRPKPAYDRQGLDWIVGPGYSCVVFSTNKTMETNQNP